MHNEKFRRRHKYVVIILNLSIYETSRARTDRHQINRDRGGSHDGGSVSKTRRRWNPGISHTNPYLSPDVKEREPLAAIAAAGHRRPMKADNGGEVRVRTKRRKKGKGEVPLNEEEGRIAMNRRDRGIPCVSEKDGRSRARAICEQDGKKN